MIVSEEDLIGRLKTGGITEIDVTNVELKQSWDQECGKKISAFANRPSAIPHFMCIGIQDNGSLVGRDLSWTKSTEETVSQHINRYLDPQIACLGVSCNEIDGQWFLLVKFGNPGSVVYWNNAAYKAAGTTIQVMLAEEIMELTVSLPGLKDFSAQHASGSTDSSFVGEFARAVSEKRSGTIFESICEMPPADALKRLGIRDTNTQQILFGDVPYRLVKLDGTGSPITNDSHQGLFGLIRPEFLAEIQSWTKEQLGCSGDPYPPKALKEGLANAVAHAAYFENQGDLILELFPDKLCISNLCLRDSEYFANKWFSRSHKTINRMLMETLRLAGLVDELGRGKNLIFSDSLRNGKRAPEVILEKGGRYDRWRLYLYAGAQDRQQLRVFERLKEMYHDENKALIANALVLWRGHTVSTIRQFVDGESSELFGNVLTDLHGPIFYYREKDQIVLRRWVSILLGEGKDSKQLSTAEEEHLYILAKKLQSEYKGGYLTPKELRELAGMGDTASEVVLSSQILKRWTDQKKITKIKKGTYRFIKRDEDNAFEQFLKNLFVSTASQAETKEAGNEGGGMNRGPG